MDAIIECMQKSSYAKGDEEWKEELDTYFIENSVHLRTRVTYDSNAMTINCCTTEKQIILPGTAFKNSCDDKAIRISFEIRTGVFESSNICNTILGEDQTEKKIYNWRWYMGI